METKKMICGVASDRDSCLLLQETIQRESEPPMRQAVLQMARPTLMPVLHGLLPGLRLRLRYRYCRRGRLERRLGVSCCSRYCARRTTQLIATSSHENTDQHRRASPSSKQVAAPAVIVVGEPCGRVENGESVESVEESSRFPL